MMVRILAVRSARCVSDTDDALSTGLCPNCRLNSTKRRIVQISASDRDKRFYSRAKNFDNYADVHTIDVANRLAQKITMEVRNTMTKPLLPRTLGALLLVSLAILAGGPASAEPVDSPTNRNAD
jgi:hypothetical protein